jgi:hypothetical protein
LPDVVISLVGRRNNESQFPRFKAGEFVPIRILILVNSTSLVTAPGYNQCMRRTNRYGSLLENTCATYRKGSGRCLSWSGTDLSFPAYGEQKKGENRKKKFHKQFPGLDS